jgi:hypothetical protein
MLFMTSHMVQIKFQQYNLAALQLHVQKWCSEEHQGYAAEIPPGTHVTS